MDGADLLAQSLKTERVAFVPGRAFFADGSNGNTLRLSFSCANEAGDRRGHEAAWPPDPQPIVTDALGRGRADRARRPKPRAMPTQASLTRRIGTVGATQVRFLFGLPFA